MALRTIRRTPSKSTWKSAVNGVGMERIGPRRASRKAEGVIDRPDRGAAGSAADAGAWRCKAASAAALRPRNRRRSIGRAIAKDSEHERVDMVLSHVEQSSQGSVDSEGG